MDRKWIKAICFILLFFAIIALGTVLKLLESFLKPVTLSVLLSFIFFPMARNLNVRFKIPWWLAVFFIYLVFFFFFFIIGNILAASARSILLSYPRYEQRFMTVFTSIAEKLSKNPNEKILFFFDFEADQTILENIAKQLNLSSVFQSLALNFTEQLVSFIKSAFLVVLLSAFLLSEMNMMKKKINAAFDMHNRIRVTQIIQSVTSEIAHYISIKFTISLITGILVTLSCIIVGLDFPLVWGFLSFIMNFVPTFGSIISCAVTILFSIIQFFPEIPSVILISVMIIAINLVLGNVIEPKIEGENLGLSPFIILVCLSLWGWLWGFMGMLIAVPLTVIIKIFCEHISILHPIAVFMGSRPKKNELPPLPNN